jgi:hypothetical protein
LEGAVTALESLSARLIAVARADIEPLKPAKLLDTLKASPKPLASLSDPDAGDRLFTALCADFAFLGQPWSESHPPSDADLARWGGLLRWVIQELRQWQNDRDSRREILIACLLVAQASYGIPEFWTHARGDIGENTELAGALKQSVGFVVVNYVPDSSSRSPIWEASAAEDLARAEDQGDLVAIDESWQPYERAFHGGNFYLVQAARYLAQEKLDLLAEATAAFRQTMAAMLVAEALAVDKRLDLALASANPLIQFACLYRTLRTTDRSAAWTDTLDSRVEQLFVKVAVDAAAWNAWMRVFNAYPLRYPKIQKALGRALSQVSVQALQAYVNSIVLHPEPRPQFGSRQQVAECLRAFRDCAKPESRRELWSIAHERWRVWNFGTGSPQVHVTEIVASALDFAVVGFACECLDANAQSAEVADVSQALETLQQEWHASESDLRAASNRLLSRFQVYAHALTIAESGGDWLQPAGKRYLPFEPTKNRYLAAWYGVPSKM